MGVTVGMGIIQGNDTGGLGDDQGDESQQQLYTDVHEKAGNILRYRLKVIK